MLLRANSQKFWVTPRKLPVAVRRWKDTSFPDLFKHQTNLDPERAVLPSEMSCGKHTEDKYVFYHASHFTKWYGFYRAVLKKMTYSKKLKCIML